MLLRRSAEVPRARALESQGMTPFTLLAEKLSGEPGVQDPKALAASIGQKKFGKAGMAAKAAAGRKHAKESKP